MRFRIERVEHIRTMELLWIVHILLFSCDERSESRGHIVTPHNKLG